MQSNEQIEVHALEVIEANLCTEAAVDQESAEQFAILSSSGLAVASVNGFAVYSANGFAILSASGLAIV